MLLCNNYFQMLQAHDLLGYPHLREVVSNIRYGINYIKHGIRFFQEKRISRNQNMVEVIKLRSEFLHDQCQKSFMLNTKYCGWKTL